MTNAKPCKQCGRVLHITNYRSYYPRGAAEKRDSAKVGHNTVCKECEAFNARINRIYASNDRTAEQQDLLDKAAVFYRRLAAAGLEPKGRYATDVLGNTPKRVNGGIDAAINFMDKLLPPIEEADKGIVDEFKRLLEIELTEEPDVYNDMLDELEERCAGPDGRVKSEYKDIYMQVLERFNDYEDNYQW